MTDYEFRYLANEKENCIIRISHNRITLNAESFKFLGCPEYISIGIDEKNSAVAFKKYDGTEKDKPYKLSQNKSSGKTVVQNSAILTEVKKVLNLQFFYQRFVECVAEVLNDMLVIKVVAD